MHGKGLDGFAERGWSATRAAGGKEEGIRPSRVRVVSSHRGVCVFARDTSPPHAEFSVKRHWSAACRMGRTGRENCEFGGRSLREETYSLFSAFACLCAHSLPCPPAPFRTRHRQNRGFGFIFFSWTFFVPRRTFSRRRLDPHTRSMQGIKCVVVG